MDINGIGFDRGSLPAELRDYSRWPQVDPESLIGDKKELFLKYYQCVTRWLDGDKVQDICDSGPISRPYLGKLLKKCLQSAPNGEIYGFRGLLPYNRQKKYGRQKTVNSQLNGSKGGMAGALTKLFEQFPELEKHVIALFLKKKDELKEGEKLRNRIPIQEIHNKFLKFCRKLGLEKNGDYPFNTKEKGLRALGNYLNKLFDSHTAEAVSARYGKDAAQKLGSGEVTDRELVTRPLQRVEFDGHRLDSLWVLKIPDRHGGYNCRILNRIWLLTIIDTYSRAIIGYFLSLNSNYNQYDVLRCIKGAIQPWRPLELTIPGLSYPPGAGLPSGVLDAYTWALWRSLVYDNAMSNLASLVRGLLQSIVGCEINAGPVSTRDHQSLIERFFGTLEHTFHQLPNTTGSDPKDPCRDNPEKYALKYEMTVDHLRQLIDYVIATYNVTPHEGIDYLAPIDVLKRYASVPDHQIRHMPETQRNQLWWFNERSTVTVRGNLSKGRRPFVRFSLGRYSSDVLRRCPDLIGQKLTLVYDPTADDCRQVMAFLQKNGQSLGMLSVLGNWGFSPHSLEVRKEIQKLKKKKKIFIDKQSDPVEIYLDYLNKTAISNKVARGKLATAFEQKAGLLLVEPNGLDHEDDFQTKTRHAAYPENKYKGRKTRLL